MAPEEQDEIEQGDDEEIQSCHRSPGIIKYPGVRQLRSGRWEARIGQEYLGIYDTAEEGVLLAIGQKRRKLPVMRGQKKKKPTQAAHTLLNFSKEAQQGIEVSGPSAFC